MDSKRTQPIGIELVKRGVVTENDINIALEYQKSHPTKKMGDILKELDVCDPQVLISAIGDILGEKGINLTMSDLQINLLEYISLDVAKQNKAVPFAIGAGKIKVCFSDVTNKNTIDTIRLLFLNKGLIMDRYITFNSNIEAILNALEGNASENIDITADISGLVDSIIKTAMEKRASDIHIEPLDNTIRVRHYIV